MPFNKFKGGVVLINKTTNLKNTDPVVEEKKDIQQEVFQKQEFQSDFLLNSNDEKDYIIEDEQEAELEVIEVKSDSVIVKVDGWRIRIYFEGEDLAEEMHVGRKIKVGYSGDIEDVHSLKFDKLK